MSLITAQSWFLHDDDMDGHLKHPPVIRPEVKPFKSRAFHLTCRPLRRRARQWRPCRGTCGPGSCCGSGKCPALRGKNYLSQPQTINPGYYTTQPVLWIRIGSNADPDCLQCGSGSSFFSPRGSGFGSGSRKLDQCGFRSGSWSDF